MIKKEELEKAYEIVNKKVNKIKKNNLLLSKNKHRKHKHIKHKYRKNIKTKKRHIHNKKSIKKMKTRRRQNGGHRTEWHVHSDD